MTVRLLFAAMVLAGCTGREPEAPKGWGDTRPTQLGRYDVSVAFEPVQPVDGELFRAVATVRYADDGTPVEDGKVVLDARMPQHGHGMETDPKQLPGDCDATGRCVHAGGRYEADGFKFHMPGEWTVTVEVQGARGADSTSFVYTLPP